jgi:hypothetical protein
MYKLHVIIEMRKSNDDLPPTSATQPHLIYCIILVK